MNYFLCLILNCGCDYLIYRLMIFFFIYYKFFNLFYGILIFIILGLLNNFESMGCKRFCFKLFFVCLDIKV